MIQKSVINKASKIRMLKFSNSFFSKLVQWWIEHYSTEATISKTFDRVWHKGLIFKPKYAGVSE